MRRWAIAIRNGKKDLDDKPRSGRPTSARTDSLESMRGQRFSAEEDVNRAYKAGIAAVTNNGMTAGIDGLVRRWEKCIEAEGSYFE
ncbi:hypothetical protein BOX15_Mlig010858g1 [Macrostomum lignano]|uniref:Uncharacterized protein n=1 Tax=Macrostomum lignano TaxID=282301 RepID=A0A267GMM7_9PLAT|nr:hypothetical protein BOX15_Mlig010858g1 [Macrostomum lignano]